MYYYLYETTNNINGKKYRGCHQTDNLDDGYRGSGTALRHAIKKYGKENFSTEIISYHTNRKEMLDAESIFVDIEWVNDRSNYNMKLGGEGFTTDDTTGEKNGFYGKRHSQETKDNHSAFMAGNLVGEKNGFYGKIHSEETKMKIIESCKKSALYGDDNPAKREDSRAKISKGLRGKAKSESHKNNLSKSKIRTYILTSPTGVVYEMFKGEIHSFCVNNELFPQIFRESINKGVITEIIVKRAGRYTKFIPNTIGWKIDSKIVK